MGLFSTFWVEQRRGRGQEQPASGSAWCAGHENAGRLGALAAVAVIEHIGARPLVSLKQLAQDNRLPV